MKASDELVKAFEGIGFENEKQLYRKDMSRFPHNEFNLVVTTQQLQEWMFNNKGIWVEVTHIGIGWKFSCRTETIDGSKMHFEIFDNPHEALQDGLFKAVEIVKEMEKV